jgi:hypothetical protein
MSLLRWCGVLLLGAALAACTSVPLDPDGADDGAGGDDDDDDGDGGDGGGSGVTVTVAAAGPSSGTGATEDCSEEAKLVYLVSVQNDLWSFDPERPGLDAYRRVGALSCPSASSPQSMSVDRSGQAWVFYSDGHLFRVSTTDASCRSTSYVHPVQDEFNQLGMGFTSTAPGMYQEALYVVSPDFGLATIAAETLAVTQLGVQLGAAELTGGFDARLFVFQAQDAALGEIDPAALTSQALHSFAGLSGTQAWAFSRYAGTFYLFTSPQSGIGSRATAFDPVAGTEAVRDADVGFTVVGAGQSICVPPPVAPN